MTSKKELLFKSVYKTGFAVAFGLSMGVCGVTGASGGMIVALISAAFLNITPDTLVSPVLTEFLIVTSAASMAGPGAAAAVAVPGAILMFFLSRSKALCAAMRDSGGTGIISLFTALAVTILVTNTYFGIGASGSTVIEMLRTYRSLGFHPNWRGILYGTIVMVVMITFPRKFKKAKNIMNMAFAALLITFVLNLCLTPGSMPVPFAQVCDRAGTLFDLTLEISGRNILLIIVSALAFGITGAVCAAGESSLPGRAGASLSAAASSVFGCPVTAGGNSAPRDYISGIIAAAASGLIFIITNGFSRLPAASCAVVLIVAGWQSLDKPSLRRAFGGAGAIVSSLIILASLATIPAFGVLAAFAFAVFKTRLKGEGSSAPPEV